MFRYLADQNFNGKIVRGALLQNANLEIVRIQDTEIDGAKDPEVLSWAAKENRIVLTHDRVTMPHFAHQRVTAGEPMPGVLVVDDWLGIGQAIEELLLIDACALPEEIDGCVIFLPL